MNYNFDAHEKAVGEVRFCNRDFSFVSAEQRRVADRLDQNLYDEFSRVLTAAKNGWNRILSADLQLFQTQFSQQSEVDLKKTVRQLLEEKGDLTQAICVNSSSLSTPKSVSSCAIVNIWVVDQ